MITDRWYKRYDNRKSHDHINKCNNDGTQLAYVYTRDVYNFLKSYVNNGAVQLERKA